MSIRDYIGSEGFTFENISCGNIKCDTINGLVPSAGGGAGDTITNTDGSITITGMTGAYVLSNAGNTIVGPCKISMGSATSSDQLAVMTANSENESALGLYNPHGNDLSSVQVNFGTYLNGSGNPVSNGNIRFTDDGQYSGFFDIMTRPPNTGGTATMQSRLNITSNGIVSIPCTVGSTGTTTGALVVGGGVGIGGILSCNNIVCQNINGHVYPPTSSGILRTYGQYALNLFAETGSGAIGSTGTILNTWNVGDLFNHATLQIYTFTSNIDALGLPFSAKPIQFYLTLGSGNATFDNSRTIPYSLNVNSGVSNVVMMPPYPYIVDVFSNYTNQTIVNLCARDNSGLSSTQPAQLSNINLTCILIYEGIDYL